MYTSGLVIRLKNDEQFKASALTAIMGAGAFTAGPMQGDSVALVMEVDNAQSAQQWHDWLLAVPGVEAAEVVFVHWDEADRGGTHVAVC